MPDIARFGVSWFNRRPRLIASRWLWFGMATPAIVVILVLSWRSLFQSGTIPDSASNNAAEGEFANGDLLLTENQASAAGIHCVPLVRQVVRPSRAIPAIVQFDPARRTDVTAPADGLITKLFVVPGQAVHAGDPLALLSAEEIGLARNDLLMGNAELDAARRAAERQRQIETHLVQLLNRLVERPEVEEIEREFADETLGDYRGQIIGAYAKLRLAESLASNANALSADGVVSSRNAAQRKSDLQIARAEFDGSCEVSRFACVQSTAASQQRLDQAERMVRVRRERLNALEGATEIGPDRDEATSHLNELVIRAPWNATVIRVDATTNARAAAGQILAELADASRLWIAASIHERDLASVNVRAGESMAVSIAAFPNEQFTATAKHSDAHMDNETRSVLLIAELENSSSRLKPGMFAWLQVPNGTPHEAIVAPLSALMHHEGHEFVFLRTGQGRFRRRDVKSGWSDDSSVELAGDFDPGQEVVDQGAFVLKSMALLEQDSE